MRLIIVESWNRGIVESWNHSQKFDKKRPIPSDDTDIQQTHKNDRIIIR